MMVMTMMRMMTMIMMMMMMMTMMNRKLTRHISKTPVSQLVNAEVNSGNR